MPELAPAGPALAQQTVRETLQNVKQQAMQMITPIYNPKVKRYQDPETERFVGNSNVERVEKPVGVEKKGKEVEPVQGVVKGAGLVVETKDLPESLWLKSDEAQFEWLDNVIGGRPEGMTWHHTEVPGKMELVPFGIHNITIHNGGRSTGMWADAPR
ncbi:HNH endonuclease [Priestia flexa]|nr:HNH endonuclease [Priestia flexa]MEC0667403.1 HNH endonuclease [Priestia flexa]